MSKRILTEPAGFTSDSIEPRRLKSDSSYLSIKKYYCSSFTNWIGHPNKHWNTVSLVISKAWVGKSSKVLPSSLLYREKVISSIHVLLYTEFFISGTSHMKIISEYKLRQRVISVPTVSQSKSQLIPKLEREWLSRLERWCLPSALMEHVNTINIFGPQSVCLASSNAHALSNLILMLKWVFQKADELID